MMFLTILCNRIVFEIVSVPAFWQKAIDQVLQEYPKSTQSYLDVLTMTVQNDRVHLQISRSCL